MRASQFTAGLFAGALALLGVMSTAEKPFASLGEDAMTEAPATTIYWTAAPQIQSSQYGDFNHDGWVNAEDAAVILQYAAKVGTNANVGSFQQYINELNEPATETHIYSIDEEAGALYVNGVSAVIGKNCDAFISVNSPLRSEKAPNCLGVNGNQIEYSYLDYVITVNEADHCVMFIDVTGSSYFTQKGIHVGSSRADAKAAYGTDGTFTIEDHYLTFIYRDGQVSMITLSIA